MPGLQQRGTSLFGIQLGADFAGRLRLQAGNPDPGDHTGSSCRDDRRHPLGVSFL